MTHKFASPKIILRADTNEVRDLISGCGRGVAHSTPTDQKLCIAPIFVHSSTCTWLPKEKPAGGRWGIFNKRRMGGRGAGGMWGDSTSRGGSRHVERQRQCNKRWCYSQPVQMRGWHNKRQQDNQMVHSWKAVARQEVAVQQEDAWQLTGQMGGTRALRGANTSRGREVAQL